MPARLLSAALEGLYAPRSGIGAQAPTDDTYTMRPPLPRATRWRPTAWLNRNAPVRWLSRALRHCAALSSREGALMLLPAQYTSRSMRSRASTAACTAAPSATSTAIAAWPPAPGSAAASARACSRFMSATTTAAPRSASARHTALPMPPAPPGTIATRPANSPPPATCAFIAALLSCDCARRAARRRPSRPLSSGRRWARPHRRARRH